MSLSFLFLTVDYQLYRSARRGKGVDPLFLFLYIIVVGESVHCFNSFFFKKLSENGYSSVRRWTRKVDIFSKNRIIIPINTNNVLCPTTHWTMAVIDVRRKEIRYCDSMGGSGRYILNTLLEYLASECSDKKNDTLQRNEWKLQDMKRTIPQQNNCCDCGVFTCANCILSSLNLVCICRVVHCSRFPIRNPISLWSASILCILFCMVV